jgi:trehalose 6-phosphate synthase
MRHPNMLPGAAWVWSKGPMTSPNPLVIVSNRAPVNFVRDQSGTLQAKRGAGGLVVVLGPGAQRSGALWLAASTDFDVPAADVEGLHYQPVLVDHADYGAYYDVVANQTLWFCLHGLWDLPRQPRFDRYWWDAWRRFRIVNEQFAAAADAHAAPGGTVLIQDYQLALVPALLAKRRPDLRTAAFMHTPWCSPEELAVLPDEVADAVLSGLAGGGVCGFHSQRWASSYTACCQARLGFTPSTFVAPAATDLDDLRSVASSQVCADELARLESLVGDRKLIVRVDRIELSKNVLRGFWAFDELLENDPGLRGRVVFAAMVYPSRLGLAEYQAYGQEVVTLAGRLNAKWGREDWTPILIDPDDNHPRSVAALRRYDVLLVNPVRDGLNLVAKEGPLVNERDGALVLSRDAGSFDSLSEHAIGVNPFDVSGTAHALARAVSLTAADRASMASGLRAAASSGTPLDWFDTLVSSASLLPG